MHFPKVITVFIVVAVTGAFASPTFREESGMLSGTPIAGLETFEALESGVNADGPFFEAPTSSLEPSKASMHGNCFMGPCLHSKSTSRKCPLGSYAADSRWCGSDVWHFRAVCCPGTKYRQYNRRDLVDKEGQIKPSLEVEVDKLD